MAGKEESLSLKPGSIGSIEAEEGALVRCVGKEASSLKPCTQKMKPCTNTSTASAGAFTGKEDIAGKQASSLKLCPAECISMEGINGEQKSSLKLCPAESRRMENINGEQDWSLKMCATKSKVPTARYLPPLKGGTIKIEGEEYCSEGDILVTASIFSEDMDKCADVTMVAIEEQAINDIKVVAQSKKGASGTCFSEEEDTGDEDFDWSTEEDDDDDDVVLSKADFQLVIDRADAKYNRFIERLLARNKTMPIKDYTAADFVDSDDEEVVLEVAL
jgi:hypothetical protein